MSTLSDIGAEIKAASDHVDASVVAIGGGRGAGIVVAKDRVLTNAHNLRGDTTRVTFAGGRTVQGKVAGADADGDLAVLEVKTENAPAMEWSDEEVAMGRAVFSASRTASGGLRATGGYVSATERAFRGPRGRRISGSIEHTAPLPRGSSGGPLFDEQGKLLGINTNRIGQGFYLALPASAETKNRVDALAKGESPSRVRLGVGIAPAHVAARLRKSVGLDEREGLLVRSVEEDSVAARAGVQRGDLIEQVGEYKIASVDDLFDALESLNAGTKFDIKIVRGASDVTLSADAMAEGDE